MKHEDDDYQKVVASLKNRFRGNKQNSRGATAVDICALTALPLHTVRELLPKAADEYSGHLKVTESGEILYHYPNGFISKYRGFWAFLKKFTGKAASFLKKTAALFFKIWIMVMLVGYFVLFIALAVLTVVISIAGKSSGKSRGGSGVFSIFELLIRLWFYSEITKTNYDYDYDYRRKPKTKEQKRPMHKAIFSFIFGEEDPNKNWDEKLNKSVIAFLQANNGVISLPEYMIFSGEDSLEAEKNILSFCSKYSGSPEATEDGTIVYRFDELLTRSDTGNSKESTVGVQQIKEFSSNSKSKNAAFIIINAVNLIFGSYFLTQSINFSQMLTNYYYMAALEKIVEEGSKMYAYTHMIMEYLNFPNPHILIGVVLGVIPLVFSVFFWAVPLIRMFSEKKYNEKIKTNNFKRFGFNKIWSALKNISIKSFTPPNDLFRPKDINAAADTVIKDIGAFSSPEVEINASGETVYSFNELEREKTALSKYRSTVDTSRLQLGKTVFDSND